MLHNVRRGCCTTCVPKALRVPLRYSLGPCSARLLGMGSSVSKPLVTIMDTPPPQP